MKIIAISDLHLGRTLNQTSLLEDQRYILFDQVLPIAKEKKADVLLLSGDIYDSINPSNDAMALYSQFLSAAHEAGFKVIAISGNHDSAVRLEQYSSLLKEADYYVYAKYDGTVRKVVLKDEYGPVNFYLLPYLTPELVAAYHRDEVSPSTSYDEAYGIALDKEKVDTSERNVLLTHQYVNGSQRDTSDIKPLLRQGQSDAVSMSHFKNFDYVALGHIHKTYGMRDNTVVYPGSIYPYAIDESNDRFVSYVELKEKDNIHQEFVPLHLKRKVLTIKGTFDEVMAHPSDKENYIFVCFTDEKTSPSLTYDLEMKFPLFLGSTRIGKAYSSTASSNASVSSLSREEIIEQFYFEKTGEKMSEEERKIIAEVIAETEKEEER